MKIMGKVIPGFAEAKDFMPVYEDAIKKIAGFQPYPGTLNLQVEDDFFLKRLKGTGIQPEDYGRVTLHSCTIKGLGCFIVVPEKTRHEKTLEIIAEFNLREKLGLKDGDNVVVEV